MTEVGVSEKEGGVVGEGMVATSYRGGTFTVFFTTSLSKQKLNFTRLRGHASSAAMLFS